MPGIAGIIKSSSEDNTEKTIKTMIKCMMHEKFYTSGTYKNEKVGILVGWVLHKDSFSDCLPIWNESKDICLVFSGENFIDTSEILNLKKKGHYFETDSAGYLIHLYEEMGIRFLENLNGWFSGILVDFRKNKVVLFNDRYGLNRIYYHENKDGFYFSSEAKAILKILPELRQLDTCGLGELFSCGCTLNNKTIFSNISLVPGGSRWTFYSNKKVKKEIYFKKNIWENLPTLSKKEYYEKLKETFSRILARYLSGKHRVAMSLTGGIDTRMIMAWAPHNPFKLPCYTFGGMYRDCADVKIARKVASVCQQRHETIKLNRKFFSEFPALAKRTVYYTDGAMDVSGSVELFLNKKAREIASVRLTGNYGDQVLRNVIGFKPVSLYHGIFDQEFIRYMNDGAKNYNKIAKDSSLSFFSFKQVPWHHYARLALEQTQLTMRSPFLDNDLVALAYQTPPELARSTELSLHLIAEGDPALTRIATDRGVTFKPIPIISTARSLYQAFTIKAEYAYDYGMPQWLAKLDHFFAPLHLEGLFLGRHKFYHFRMWYRNELSRYVKDIILSPRTRERPYLRGDRLEKMVNSHLNGRQNYTQEIHWLLTSELIQRHLIEKK
jgi:asparagine synthase (glutamine-hydrolysing)